MVISSEGDIGDAAVILGVLSQLPGAPHSLLFERSTMTKFKTEAETDRLVSLIKPLADLQPYVSECRKAQLNERIDWKSAGFRVAPFHHGRSLLDAHVIHLVKVKGIGHNIKGKDRWLHNVTPRAEAKDRIIINRSGRYRNGFFPWKTIVKHYHWRLLFIGLQHEYREFCSEFGYVDYQPTANMLEVAEWISGSLLFIGNQSACNAVCEGLKHPLIQETCAHTPDCVYARDNAQHVVDGETRLPGFDGEETVTVPCAVPEINYNISTATSPPGGGWLYPGMVPHPVFKILQRNVVRMHGLSDEEARRAIIKATVEKHPDAYPPGERTDLRRQMEAALHNSRHG